jgi:PAS domain S-box-containing protein
MKETMHLVARGWYHLYYGVMLAFSAGVMAAYAATAYVPALERYADTFGLDMVILALAGMHVFYCLTLYWPVRRMSQPLALLISSLLLALTIFYGIVYSSDTGMWVYIGGWLASSIFIGMYGLALALGSILLSLVFVLLDTDFRVESMGLQLGVFLAGSAIITLLGYLFWRERFENSEASQLNRLSGMLRSKQEQSAILIQSLTDGVIVTDTQCRVTLINPAAAKLTGWTVADATNVDARLVAKLAQENGAALKDDENPFAAVLTQKQHLTKKLQLIDRGNNQRIISLAISPVLATGGALAGAVAVMRDISQEHAAEQQRAEFISTASHEMRTPVAAIEGYLALALNDKVSTIDARARNYIEKAHASTQHLGKLFQDLLTSAKAEDGRLSSHPTVVEMGSFLEQLVEDLRFTAQKKGLVSEFVVGENQTIDATKSEVSTKVVKPLYYVYADPDRLREVVSNLFDNAIKYTDQGKITLGLTGNTEIVQFYIRDTGAGIPADDIPHMFQKFYRVDSSATRVVGGTGLGLFISRKIIELYNGRIWVESELGKGSTFYINLPRLSTQRAQQLQAAEAAAQSSGATVRTAKP